MRQASVFVALAAAGWAVTVPLPASARYGPGVLPPYEIVTILRSTDLRPVGPPVRRGRSYVVSAIDGAGDDVRVVVDARNGEIISVRPLRRYVGRPYARERVYVERDPVFGGPPVVLYEPESRYYPPEALPERRQSAPEPRVLGARRHRGASPRRRPSHRDAAGPDPDGAPGRPAADPTAAAGGDQRQAGIRAGEVLAGSGEGRRGGAAAAAGAGGQAGRRSAARVIRPK